MLLPLLATLARAAPDAGPGAVDEAADLALLGPLPAGTTLDRLERHPEYVRYHLRADRPFVIEVTPARGGTPVCGGGGVDLWVRVDLSGDTESFVWDPLPPIVGQACARLADHAPAFAPLAPEGAKPVPAGERPPPSDAPWRPLPPWGWRPLHALVVPFLALCAWLLPRDRAALGVGLLALLVRLGLTPRTVLLGGDAAYERLLRARGLWDPDAYYGETWPALLGLLWRAAGSPAHHVHAVNIGLSALTAAFTVALARRVGVPEAGALAAGVLLALHPLAVAVGGMEDMFVLVGFLQVVAVTAAVGPPAHTRAAHPAPWAGAPDAWAAAVAVALLAHLRPEQAVFALVPLALLARRRAWAPLALAVVLCAVRWAGILGTDGAVGGGADILAWSRWTSLNFVLRLPVPWPGTPAVLLDPARSPLAFAGLAGIGLISAVRRPEIGRLAIPFAALLLPLLVVLPKTLPLADPVRFQLPGFAFAAVLAGAGLLAVRGHARAAWILALVVTGFFARRPLDGGWAWAHEYTFLRAHLADMPADTLVLYRPDQDPHHQFGAWIDDVSPGRWRPMGSAPAAKGAWYWRGFADGVAETWPPMPCDLEPLAVTEVSSRTDGWITLPPGPLQVGFYRVGACE